MKWNSILAATTLWAVAVPQSWALEIRNGSIEFTHDRVFYNNLPETLVSALVHPGVRTGSKKAMILRMAQDPNLPGSQYNVLFHPDIHRSREITLAVMYALQNHHPEHLSRLGKFQFTVDAVLEMLSLPSGERYDFQPSQNEAAEAEINNLFLDQALAWLEEIPQTEIERLRPLQAINLLLKPSGKLAGTDGVYRFGSRYEKDDKKIAYDSLLLHLRAARLALKAGLVQTAKQIQDHIRLSLPPDTYTERPPFIEELEQVRSEVKELARELATSDALGTTSPQAPAPGSAPALVPPVERAIESVVQQSPARRADAQAEAQRPTTEVAWIDFDHRPEEKALLDAADAKDGFAMSLAVTAWPEGVRLSKLALVKLSHFMTCPNVEISEALRRELAALVLPQLEERRSELAYQAKLSDRNQALLDACNTLLLPKFP